MDNNNIIIDKVKKIQDWIENKYYLINNPFLLGGNGGTLLFLALLVENDLYNGCCFNKVFNDIVSNNSILNNISLSTGYSGIYFCIYLLMEKGFIDEQDFSEFPIHIIPITSNSLLKKGNYDLLHGALGGFYVLLRCKKFLNNEDLRQIKESIEYLYSDIVKGESKIIKKQRIEKGRQCLSIDFGLAHGIPSVIKYLLMCYVMNIQSEKSKEIIRRLIDILLMNKNEDYKSLITFPYKFDFENPTFTPSRLGWCYGDLGIGYILYQVSIVFPEFELTKEAIGVLKKCTFRKDINETLVFDASFCHGSAGVAHIFNKIWSKTMDYDFKNASDFWIQKTLNFSKFEDGIAGYKMYNPLKNKYEISHGLLDGAIGIGLSLLSTITKDFSWDYPFMINDIEIHG